MVCGGCRCGVVCVGLIVGWWCVGWVVGRSGLWLCVCLFVCGGVRVVV